MSDMDPDSRAWKELRRVMDVAFVEQRRSRRWGIFFKLVTLAYVTFLIVAVARNASFDEWSEADGGHLASVSINGTIAADSDASAEVILQGIAAALEHPGTRGVVLDINSGGGSPVQADRVWRGIQRLRGEYPDTPIYAAIADIGASGAYYIASAADEIYADEASLVGSIGVVSSGFGFEDAAKKLGVERRLITAGTNKGLLDPFLPLDKAQVEHWQRVLDGTHEQFINRVKSARGARLVEDDSLFSGLIWNGRQALALGLIDGHLSPAEIADENLGVDRVLDFTPRPAPLERLTRQLGASVSASFNQLLGAGLRY
ncbi:S49 family peptidase [Litorivicinus lipolyticus]|uniref:S49 family peptidase n=1 Tax=Litorivicinus lipolyticus TaxID=418701 RepID=UPI003B5C7D7E